MLRIVEVDPQGADALALLREAAIEARALYPELFAPGSPWPGNAPNSAGEVYLVAYRTSAPVACGALRSLAEGVAEVRRMFVTKSARREGLASTILKELEAKGQALGYGVLRLETGYKQGPAIALYEAHGFKRIEPFGEYANDPTSVCFEKVLSGNAAGAA